VIDQVIRALIFQIGRCVWTLGPVLLLSGNSAGWQFSPSLFSLAGIDQVRLALWFPQDLVFNYVSHSAVLVLV